MCNLNFDIWKFGHPQCANSANGALSKLTWSGDQYADESTDYEDTDAPPVTLDTTMTEADFSGKHLGVSGSMVLAAFISSKSFQDKGALASVNIQNNDIDEDRNAEIQQICDSKSITCLL